MRWVVGDFRVFVLLFSAAQHGAIPLWMQANIEPLHNGKIHALSFAGAANTLVWRGHRGWRDAYLGWLGMTWQ